MPPELGAVALVRTPEPPKMAGWIQTPRLKDAVCSATSTTRPKRIPTVRYTELEPVWADYGVFQARVEGGSEENYLVDHSSRVYVVDADGNLRLTYLFGTEYQLITEDVRHLVSLQQDN